MSSSANIVTEEKDGVLTISLHNPAKKNALTDAAYLGIAGVLEGAAANDAVTAVIVTGLGDYFCSGTDVTESSALEATDMPNAPVGRFMLAVIRFPKVLVAAVNGPAIGIGVTLLPHCDLVYCTASASFWTPFMRIAVVPELGSSLTFPRIMGPALAGDMLLASRVMSAPEAQQCGLVSQIQPDADFLPGIKRKLQEMLSQPLGKESLLLYKRMLRRWTQEEVEKAVLEELEILGQRRRDGDTKYALGVTMEREKRLRMQRKAAPKDGPRSRL